MRNNSSDYRELFLNEVPMMDARAPMEFAKGALLICLSGRPIARPAD